MNILISHFYAMCSKWTNDRTKTRFFEVNDSKPDKDVIICNWNELNQIPNTTSKLVMQKLNNEIFIEK